MKFVLYTEMAQLPLNANVLFAQAAKDSLFFSRAWFENLLSTASQDMTDVCFACVIDRDKVLAILPLMTCFEQHGYALKHRYSSLYSLLLAEDEDNTPQILACFVQGLRANRIRALSLEPIDKNDKRLNALQTALQAAGFACERHFRFYNWIHTVQEQSYSDYLAKRPSKLRNTLARKQRKLKREHGYQTRLYLGKQAIQAIDDYHAVYNASWKAREQYMDIVNGMVNTFSPLGWTRLGVLYINEQPVAAQLWFVVHGKASIFRLAYDETWKKYSVGSILTDFIMQHVIDIDQVTEIDFLTGNEVYKQDWMSERRERWALSCIDQQAETGKMGILMDKLRSVFQ